MGLTRALIAPFAIAAALAGCGGDGDHGADLGTEELIGRAFVEQRGCAQCHQASGSNAPVLAGGVEVKPGIFSANLTPDGPTGLGHWADIEIVRAMRYGFDADDDSLCPTMPHFDGSDANYPLMTDVEANAIVAYLRSLPPVAQAVPESSCPPIKPHPAVDMAASPQDPVDMAGSAHD